MACVYKVLVSQNYWLDLDISSLKQIPTAYVLELVHSLLKIFPNKSYSKSIFNTLSVHPWR
jgi:hypothetical protein